MIRRAHVCTWRASCGHKNGCTGRRGRAPKTLSQARPAPRRVRRRGANLRCADHTLKGHRGVAVSKYQLTGVPVEGCSFGGGRAMGAGRTRGAGQPAGLRARGGRQMTHPRHAFAVQGLSPAG
jgi:hypothetical protein